MAAKLKKRALAEYQSQVQVEDKDKEVASPENKRLKLSLRSESPEPKPVESILPVLDTEVATTREVIENIISFNVSAVTNHSPEVIAAALKKMSELVSKEKDDSVKAKLVSLWGEILELAGSEEMPARLEELVSLSEKSNKVLVSWLATLKRLVNAHSLSKGERRAQSSLTCYWLSKYLHSHNCSLETEDLRRGLRCAAELRPPRGAHQGARPSLLPRLHRHPHHLCAGAGAVRQLLHVPGRESQDVRLPRTAHNTQVC